MMDSTPRIITGVFAFAGTGLHNGGPLMMGSGQPVSYTVPSDKRAQLVYLRAGNSAQALVSLVLLRDGVPMRLFPLGAQNSVHVPLAVVEDLYPDTVISLGLAAPEGVTGHVVLDMGLVEI